MRAAATRPELGAETKRCAPRARPRGVAVLALLAGCIGGVKTHAQDLTVVSWGGAYTKSQILGFIRDYEADRGIDVEVVDYNGGLVEIRDQVRAYNVKWDAVALEPADALRACGEGLLVEIDTDTLASAPDGTPARDDFLPSALTPCAIGSVVWSTVVAYDPAAVERAPRRLEHFFEPERYPGARGMRRTPRVNLEWALIADGVDPGRVYDVLETEAGLQRAFRVLDRIKPGIVWWRAGAEAASLLETGRVAMTTAYNGRIYESVTSRGYDFEILWDRQIWSMDLWGIPANGERTAQALDFVRFATRTESLAAQTEHISYGPTRRSALARADADVVPHLPTAPGNFDTALELDAEWWAEHIGRLTARFERWIERPVRVPEALPR